jgi:hypothetical protein
MHESQLTFKINQLNSAPRCRDWRSNSSYYTYCVVPSAAASGGSAVTSLAIWGTTLTAWSENTSGSSRGTMLYVQQQRLVLSVYQQAAFTAIVVLKTSKCKLATYFETTALQNTTQP